MATSLPHGSNYLHICRADGTIKLITRGPVTVEDDEVAVSLPYSVDPASHFYDPKSKSVLPYSQSRLTEKKKALADALQRQEEEKKKAKATLRKAVDGLSKNNKAAFEALLVVLNIKT